MKVFIATGGSGGHIFPALTLAEMLQKEGHEVIIVGSFKQWRDIVMEKGFQIEELPVKTLAAKSLKEALVSVGCMLKSFIVASKLIERYRPERIIGFGGYASFPTVLAGLWKKVFTAVHEQNVIPGRANRILAFFVRKIFVSFPQSRRFFAKEKCVVSGYPIRAFKKNFSKEDCRKELGLDQDALTIAVFGGSQGSRAVNQAMISAAELLKQEKVFQVVHIAGEDDLRLVTMAYEKMGVSAAVFPFFYDMEKIYMAADLVLARAGAGSVHEIAKFGIPAIIIPYPFAGDHQKQNALAFLKMGRGIMIEEKYLKADRLCTEIINVINNCHSGDDRLVHDDVDAAHIIIRDLVES